MFGSYSEVRSNTSIAIENSLRLSISPSIVRFTMCVRNRHSRIDETKPGLFTTRDNWSRTAVAGTGSAAELARDFPGDDGGVGTCLFSPFIMLHKTSQCYGELTAAYGQSKASGHNVELGRCWRFDADPQTSRNSDFCVPHEPRSRGRAGHRSART